MTSRNISDSSLADTPVDASAAHESDSTVGNEAPAAATNGDWENSENTQNEDASDQIESDIHALLSEMDASYKTFTETVFAKIDKMSEKISQLERSTKELQGNAAGQEQNPVSPARRRRRS